MKELSTF